MKKYALVLVVVLFIFSFVISVFSNDVVWEDISRGNTDIKTILVKPDNPRLIYMGDKAGVLKSEDGGSSWRSALSIRGQNKAVNFLSVDPQDKNSIYAATGAGLFVSNNQGNSWNRIFKGKSALESECTALAILPTTIYLGTKGGLFVSKDKGRSWHKETGKIGNSKILAIVCNLKEPDYVYVACIDGVYKSRDNGETWERVFVAKASENGDDKEEEVDDQDEEERSSEIRYISINPNNPACLYLATAKGVYKSQDKGETWVLLPEYGLLSQDVRFLFVSEASAIYAATKTGVFEFNESRWQEKSFGLTAADIRFLTLDNQNNLYVACEKGLFKANLLQFNDTKDNNIITLYSKDEPKINEVQKAAIKYAEVDPKKIKRWRKQAAAKAFLPKVSAGVGRNTTDLWHWESGSSTKAGDDVLTRGRDSIDWDLALSWDLGEIIWNADQASIDVRSRLMVQLRDDILDEVTKIYFERLRVKLELDNLSIIDRKKRVEKELRLQELAASLDALTGGYFSQQIKVKNAS